MPHKYKYRCMPSIMIFIAYRSDDAFFFMHTSSVAGKPFEGGGLIEQRQQCLTASRDDKRVRNRHSATIYSIKQWGSQHNEPYKISNGAGRIEWWSGILVKKRSLQEAGRTSRSLVRMMRKVLPGHWFGQRKTHNPFADHSWQCMLVGEKGERKFLYIFISGRDNRSHHSTSAASNKNRNTRFTTIIVNPW